MKNIKLAYASIISSTITVAAIAVVTIWAELSPSFKTFLASFTGHHWVTKSWIAVILYALLLAYVFTAAKNVGQTVLHQSIRRLIIATVLSGAAILVFYVWHYL